jgi:hypothetical protein
MSNRGTGNKPGYNVDHGYLICERQRKNMNQKELMWKKSGNYKKYHVPGCTEETRRPKNAIYIRPGNSIKHEVGKLEICHRLQSAGHDFITEAKENESGLVRDVVDLDTGQIYEVETDVKRAARHGKDIIVKMV